MPHYCAMDDGWPKKRCKVTKGTVEPFKCRHWLKGLPKDGCGAGLWRVTCKDGTYDSIFTAPEYQINKTNEMKT